jgi:ubiquinone/menaquinone biosynthesis C-methylase UbiE
MSDDKTRTLSFTGSVPSNYDEYLGPMFFEQYAIDIASRVRALNAKSVLELCCGTGRVTRHLRNAVSSSSRFIASDISADMLQVAQSKLQDSKIDWQIVDAQQIPFEANEFDVVVCAFGYMLVPDRAKAFAETLRVLRNGGTLVMSTWDTLERNEASSVFRSILKQELGDSLPETYRMPFALNDPEDVRKELSAAGFSNVIADVVEKKSVCATAKEAAYGLVHGGSLYNEISKQGTERLNKIQEMVEVELSGKYGAAPMAAPMSAIITEAKKA